MASQPSGPHGLGIYDERSQRSILREATLREELGLIGQRITRTQESIEKLETNRARMARSLALMEPARFREEQLDECIQNLESARVRLKIYEQEREKTNQAISEICPTAARLKVRQALQDEFAQLADKRIKKTRQAQALLGQFRQALQERVELAAKMRTAAEQLECDISGDGLDETRFDDLLASLPDDLLSASEVWHSSLGSPVRRKG